ncbi:sensor histidine kinase [Cytobacillus sp. FJAT-54145]|uniref:histidine kinase n=1 Tax=Cytobacillus spartinae TaxID=3299023 RepID=A0ABW6K9E6_9BACI
MEFTKAKKEISSYIIQSQEEEIKRIALELHEGVGQTLYSVYTGLQFIQGGSLQPEMKNYIHEMEQLLEKTIQEIRLLSVELHPPTLATLGLVPAMKSYLKLYTSTYGIEVELSMVGEEVPIPENHNIAVFRVIQEALGNVAKYADTTHVSLSFTWYPNGLGIIIKDFGKGFNVKEAMEKSTGLAAMIERMDLINGKCEISSVIDSGTSIELFLPL